MCPIIYFYLFAKITKRQNKISTEVQHTTHNMHPRTYTQACQYVTHQEHVYFEFQRFLRAVVLPFFGKNIYFDAMSFRSFILCCARVSLAASISSLLNWSLWSFSLRILNLSTHRTYTTTKWHSAISDYCHLTCQNCCWRRPLLVIVKWHQTIAVKLRTMHLPLQTSLFSADSLPDRDDSQLGQCPEKLIEFSFLWAFAVFLSCPCH